MKKNELNQTEGITNMVTKENSNSFKEFVQSAATIIGVMAVALVIALFCKKAMVKDSEQELSIGTNSAEVSFYNADYDQSISAYDSDGKNEEWPLYKAKEAEAYSLKGDYTYSNRLLSEAYDTRNELIRKNGIGKYEECDKELGNLIVFTALMNGDTEKALEYGEIFFLDHEDNKQLDKSMFTVYLANGNTEKAKEILNDIDFDETSAYDLAEKAYMNMIVGNYDDGITYLKKAYEADKDEIKIYDVLEDIMAYHRKNLEDRLKSLSKNESKELSYKIMLAKCYSLDSSKNESAQKLLDELKDEDVAAVPYKVMQADVYKNSSKTDKYNEVIEELIDDEKDNYYGKYIAAKHAYENKEYSKGIEYAKNSIIENREYVKTYSLISKLLTSSTEGKKAGSYLRTALYKEPYNYNILVEMAAYYGTVQQDTEKALKYYNIAVKIDEENADVYYNMAVAKAALDKKGEAIELLQKAIKKNEKEAKYYRKLGSIYLGQKENDKAIKAIRKAYDINNDDIYTLSDAGYYYMTVGEVDRAITNFKSAYELLNSSTDLTIKNTITTNYERAKEYKNNKTVWTKSSIEDFKYLD